MPYGVVNGIIYYDVAVATGPGGESAYCSQASATP
jgi:hypothetical protein